VESVPATAGVQVIGGVAAPPNLIRTFLRDLLYRTTGVINAIVTLSGRMGYLVLDEGAKTIFYHLESDQKHEDECQLFNQ